MLSCFYHYTLIKRRPGAVVTILELSLRILEEGDDKNGSQALQSLEICLESLEEDKVGQSRELVRYNTLNIPSYHMGRMDIYPLIP